jgi:2-polyprenyl-6-methoxyphenol hydroxylase-like FAD-dependent oxidoreductase
MDAAAHDSRVLRHFDELTEQPARNVREADVVIVGAGLSGSTAAAVLGRAGRRVVLVDRHVVCPPQFRVEKIGGEQVELFRRLGLLDRIATAGTRFDHIANVRRGRVIDRSRGVHYSLRYEEMVRAIQQGLPKNVERLADRVIDISTGAELQRIVLANQGAVEARLVVLATGMGDFLRDKLGMTRRIIYEKHSISFGFDLTLTNRPGFVSTSITYYGESPDDRVDYLSIFPMGNVLRANLFTYRDVSDPWVRDMRRAPKEALLAALPGLEETLGDFEITSPVETWAMDLCEVEGHQQDGVVLVGDAFQTSCPAAGRGVTRLLTDVERLCLLHAPNWLASRGMGREKIAEYYADPAKRATDAQAWALSHSRRALTVDTSLTGRVRRQKHFQMRRVKGWFARMGTSDRDLSETPWPRSDPLRLECAIPRSCDPGDGRMEGAR